MSLLPLNASKSTHLPYFCQCLHINEQCTGAPHHRLQTMRTVSNTYVLLILLELMVSLALPTAFADDPSHVLFRKYHIRIIDDLPDQPPELFVHCKSKNNDLGVKSLRPRGMYTIAFYVNFWKNTLFFCRLKWGENKTSFDAFRTRRDGYRCQKHGCIWSIRPDGFYFSKDWKNWRLEYKWSKNSNSSRPQ